MDRGLAVPCPECGIRGRKDDGCTHMVCPSKTCGTRFCYCCGLKRLECDGASGNNWGMHNHGWENNTKRCPMFLQHLSGVADHNNPDLTRTLGTWPDDEQGALEKFHEERILRELHKLTWGAKKSDVEAVLSAAVGNLTFDKVTRFVDRPFFRNRTTTKL